MLQLKVKTKDVRFTMPIPYALLSMGISIFSSTFFQQQLQKWTKDYSDRKKSSFTMPIIDKEMLKSIVKELKNYPGLILVDVKAQDGTEVKIRL
ncbi:hypothetical protein M1K46_21805 [Fictibacillus sp. WQ 8-8]|uniref:hypothetical protein n=1 Tax=Fictibacillus sp. WQ 8-8 TaxID=2938788 RepID=UPI0021096A29|nr:hypothetical protein [Fictibacillus sp. WQ 8-8]MCQ6268247.1 hypothetical protein [Fictibacillus sp. WQ 8-8]